MPALVGLLLLTGVGVYGLTMLGFEGEVVDVLPRGDPHTVAAHNISETFPFFFEEVGVYLTIDPDRWPDANEHLACRQTPEMPDNAYDEVYVRGVEEFVTHVREEVPAFTYSVELASLVKTFNWTNAAVPGAGPPPPSAFAMPGPDCVGSLQFRTAWEGLRQFPQASQSLSPDQRTFEIVLIFDPRRTGQSHHELGAQVIEALEAYERWAATDGQFQAFELELLAAEGLPVLDAHAAELTLEDLSTLAPIVFVAVVVVLWFAFRTWQAVAATLTTLGAAFVLSTGLLGFLGIPIANLNLAYAPVILGVGVDYTIHLTNAVLDELAAGRERTEAFRRAGRRVGIATSVATLTTVLGLSVLLFAPSPIMVQVAVATTSAILVVWALTFTALPALLTVSDVPSGRSYRPSRIVPAVAGAVGRARTPAVVVLVLVLGVSLWPAGQVEVAAFGDPEIQFPSGDRVRTWHEGIDERFFLGEPSGSTFLVLQGDVQTPEGHAYIRQLVDNVDAGPLNATRIAHLPLVVDGYLLVRNGTAGAIGGTLLPGVLGPEASYPRTEEGLDRLLHDLFASPFAAFASFFAQSPDFRATIISAEVDHGDSFAEASRVWAGLDDAVAATNGGVPPDGVQVTYFGNAAFSYLFIEAQVPWMSTLAIVVTLLVGLLALAVTRSPRATGAVLVVSVGSTLLWLAVLRIVGVQLSPLLFLPMVVLLAVGTDDAMHLVLGLQSQGERAYATVGKAVSLTTVTSAVAFALFSEMRHIGVSESMYATVLAVLITWMLSVWAVPAVLGPPRGDGPAIRSRPRRAR